MKNVSRFLIALLILVSGLAIAPYSTLSAEKLNWQMFSQAYECTDHCLRSVAIVPFSRQIPNGYLVGSIVLVRRENQNPVSRATVTVQWTDPNGSTQTQTLRTDSDGRVLFLVQGNAGTYQLNILNIQKTGYTFDPNNSLLSKTIVVP